MTVYKVIEAGEVVPLETLGQVGRRLAAAHGRGHRLDVRVLDCFPSQRERGLTTQETNTVACLAAAIITEHEET